MTEHGIPAVAVINSEESRRFFTTTNGRSFLEILMKPKNTPLALALLLQFPLTFAVVFGVHFLTGLSIWWCVPIAFVLDMMYYFGENIRRG
jgi:hypothetical protein